MRFSTILPLMLALAAAPASADVYKWTNANGETVFGQFPPAGVAAERIKTNAPPSKAAQPPAATPQERLKALQEQQQSQHEQAAETAAQKQQAAARKQNCTSARNNLAQLERGGHRRVKLPDGTVTFLSEEETQQRIEQARQHVKDNCD
ncbi:MAG: DUF4124 domain-containing protein [Thiogranum sp.]|nr:DUF4124 domain-containing protein [Thiogranum sp.]